MNQSAYQVIVIGGGAAGYFAAINCAEANPDLRILILERGKEVLQKVRISGGGRCNLTHACFDPKILTTYYPRGNRALLGPFTRFCCEDTIAWFEDRGVAIKTEADGRMFPMSNSSETIVNCLKTAAQQAGIELMLNQHVDGIQPPTAEQPQYMIHTRAGANFQADKLMLAAGSSKNMWKIIEKFGHSIIDPVPSLFTFNIKDERVDGLAGISVPRAALKLVGSKLSSEGPLLITHWGMSGPAILKMSAFGARLLFDQNYQFELSVNWVDKKAGEVESYFFKNRKNTPQKTVLKAGFPNIPTRLWKKMTKASDIDEQLRYADLSNKKIQRLLSELCEAKFGVNGKSTFKEEFVTAGGIKLKEVNFKTFESKIHPGLYFAGEILDIDALTGGFNFQAAWTGGFIAGRAMADG